MTFNIVLALYVACWLLCGASTLYLLAYWLDERREHQ